MCKRCRGTWGSYVGQIFLSDDMDRQELPVPPTHITIFQAASIFFFLFDLNPSAPCRHLLFDENANLTFQIGLSPSDICENGHRKTLSLQSVLSAEPSISKHTVAICRDPPRDINILKNPYNISLYRNVNTRFKHSVDHLVEITDRQARHVYPRMFDDPCRSLSYAIFAF